MANRTLRNSWLRFGVQSARDSLPEWGASGVVPVVGPWEAMELQAEGVERGIVGPSFGASERLPGQSYWRFSPTVEMALSGTAGTAPPWDEMLRACGMTRTDIAGDDANCQYRPVAPVNADFEFGAIRATEGGGYRVVKNALGDFTLNLRAGDVPRIKFDFTGVQHSVLAASAGLGWNYAAAWNNVQVITDDNSGDIILGGTFNASTGAISIGSGARYPSYGLTFRAGNEITYSRMLGLSGAQLVQRQPECELELYVDVTQQIALEAKVKNVEYTTLGWMIGATPGKRMGLWMPRVQLAEPKVIERDGRMHVAYKCRPVPTGTDRSDDFRLITR